MPPSHNACYRNVPRVGRVATKKLLDFRKEMQAWAFQNQIKIKEAQRVCLEALTTDWFFHVDAFFCFQTKSLYTKDGSAKMLDVSNRIKAIHDSVAELIMIDDRYFWSLTAQKVELSNNEIESATIIIKKFKPVRFDNDII